MSIKVQMIESRDGFPDRLKKAREFRNLSQSQLAKLANLPPASISNFEAGRREPSLNSFRSLVRSLAVNPDYLLNNTDSLTRSESVDPTIRFLRGLIDSDDYEAISHIVQRLTQGKKGN